MAEPAGTYMYHSHVGQQLDRGLLGPLIIEEREPHAAYDREYTLLLDEPRLGTCTDTSSGSGDALKETVLVPGHMGRRAVESTADDPGDWFFHCHDLYHLESGMARVFRYV